MLIDLSVTHDSTVINRDIVITRVITKNVTKLRIISQQDYEALSNF